MASSTQGQVIESSPIARKPDWKRITLLASPFLLLITLLGWGLSSPAGSSPDDVFHVASIWCAQGEREGICEATDQPEQRLLPSAVAHMPCFAFDSEADASCQGDLLEKPSTELVPISHGNWVENLYPPIFYGAFSPLASDNVGLSVVLIRFLNAALATILLTATLITLPQRLRPVLGLSAALTMVPFGLFLLASTNPSSWALVSVLIVFPTVMALGEVSRARGYVLISLATVGFIIGGGARGDAALFAAFAAALGWFLSAKKTWFSAMPALIAIPASILIFLSSGQSSALNGLDPVSAGASASGVTLLIYNLMQLPEFWLGMFTNLGWLDTAISPLGVFAVVAAVIGVIFVSLGTMRAKKGVAFVVVLLAFTLTPLYMLNASDAAVGAQVQPRYVLPLFVLLVAVAITPAPSQLYLTAVQYVTIAALIVGAHSIALYDQLTRYIAGERILNLDEGAWWWNNSPVSPVFVLTITSIAFAGLVLILTFYMHSQARALSTVNGHRARLEIDVP